MQILRIKHEKARAGDGYDSQRVSLLPDIPTARETGFPSLEVEGLVRLFGPRVLAGEVGARLKANGAGTQYGLACRIRSAVEEERAKTAAIAQTLGIKPK